MSAIVVVDYYGNLLAVMRGKMVTVNQMMQVLIGYFSVYLLDISAITIGVIVNIISISIYIIFINTIIIVNSTVVVIAQYFNYHNNIPNCYYLVKYYCNYY